MLLFEQQGWTNVPTSSWTNASDCESILLDDCFRWSFHSIKLSCRVGELLKSECFDVLFRLVMIYQVF